MDVKRVLKEEIISVVVDLIKLIARLSRSE